ncbi:MAG: MMPL family transporter [Myxococcota bacterium]
MTFHASALARVCARVLVRHSHFALGLAVAVTVAAGLSASRLRFDFSPDAIYLAGDPAHQAYVERYLPHFAARGGTAVVAVEGDVTREHTQRALRALRDRLSQEPFVQIVRGAAFSPVGEKSPGDSEMDSRFRGNDKVGGTASKLDESESLIKKHTLSLSLLDPRISEDKLQRESTEKPKVGEGERSSPLLSFPRKQESNPWEIAPDGAAAAMRLELPLHHGDESATQKLARRLRRVVNEVASQHPQVTVYLTGGALIQEATVGFLKRDQMVFVPLLILCIATALWLSFRDVRGVALPFVTTGVATLWTLGWLGAVGHSFNIVNNALIVLLIVIGIADSVHIFARFQDELAKKRGPSFCHPDERSEEGSPHLSKHGEILRFAQDDGEKAQDDSKDVRDDRAEAVVIRVTQAMIGPCLLTSGTTALGFASSVVAQVPIVREFGLDAAVGVMGAFVATFLIMPPLLRHSCVDRRDAINRVSTTQRSLPLGKMAYWSMRHAKVLVAAAAVVGLSAVWIAKDLRSNQRLISDLPESDEAVRGVRFIERTFAGVNPVTVLFEQKGEGTSVIDSDDKRLARWHDPAVLRSIDRIARAMQADPLSPAVHSYPQALRALVLSITGDDPGPVATWDDAQFAQADQLLHRVAPEASRKLSKAFFSSDASLQVVHGLLRDTHTRELNRFRIAMQQAVDQHGVKQAPGILTGGAVVVANALGNMIHDMVGSLMAACITILLVIAAVFRSVRYAFVALLPNVLPLVVTLAAMVLLRVDLRVATVMIFSMALGISVDACTHLLSRLREELDPCGALLATSCVPSNRFDSTGASGGEATQWPQGLRHAVARTMQGSGRPVVVSTGLLLLGFSVMGLSRFGALRDFAILAGVILGTALIVDLLLLPALIVLVRPRA